MGRPLNCSSAACLILLRFSGVVSIRYKERWQFITAYCVRACEPYEIYKISARKRKERSSPVSGFALWFRPQVALFFLCLLLRISFGYSRLLSLRLLKRQISRELLMAVLCSAVARRVSIVFTLYALHSTPFFPAKHFHSRENFKNFAFPLAQFKKKLYFCSRKLHAGGVCVGNMSNG